VIIKDPADARRATRQYHRQGASAIKVYYRLPLKSIQATCETAAELGIPVTAHLELVDADQAIRAGLRGIEHVTSFGTVLAEPELAEPFRTAVSAENEARRDGRYRLWAALNLDDSLRAKELLTLVVERGVFVSPTLATFERRAGDAGAEEFHVRGFENMMRFVGQCHRAGATIVTGSHTWSPKVELGWAYQREMELLLESGLPPMEVIKASTINNARFLGCADRVGTLEEGKLADLVLVKGDPLRDMKAMYNIRRVMLNGRWVREESR
jgi:imidazolonepropionase-like amidohydrolase